MPLEDSVDDRGLDAFLCEPRHLLPHRVHAALDDCERDQTDLATTLVGKDPHKVRIPHGIQRMILERTFVEWYGTNEQVALVDRPTGLREGGCNQHQPAARVGAERLRDR